MFIYIIPNILAEDKYFSDLTNVQYYLVDSYKFAYKAISALSDEAIVQFSKTEHD